MNSCTFVIFGATGDLTKRKLIPAIFKLVKKQKIENFAIVGLALEDVTAEKMLDKGREFINKFDEKVWQKLIKASYYFPYDFYKSEDYTKLAGKLDEIEKKHGLSGNRLFYLATMPEHFAIITENLASSGIVEPVCEGQKCLDDEGHWSRIVYEKPFGYDLASAKKINAAISKVFSERQIYRIDHYLGKELIGNIALVRFTNRVLEPLWSNHHIDSVQIILSEAIGIEGRGKFYDSVGAVKDMVQSHMLQMVALVGMEAPQKFLAEYIRDAKAQVLKDIVINHVIFGQYDGYRQERDVNPDSDTETFVALNLGINNHRWKGVPFYLKTGKCLEKKETSIHIRFKMEKCLLTHNCPTDANYLTIRIQPDAGIYLELNAKVPGKLYDIAPVQMSFFHGAEFGANTPEAYETLLYDVIRGDQSVFLREDEIEFSWKIVEDILKLKTKVYPYEQGSDGPEELSSLASHDPLRWRG